MSKETEYKLSDEVISQIAKLVQIAIITGTDVVDNLRTLRVVSQKSASSLLVLSDEYRKNSEDQIQSMLESIKDLESESQD
jgi:hypothetical protein|tara:strand:+ start:4985 stop:5227 length:243 start_codon:yes stop_codon:yes gene_type:complete